MYNMLFLFKISMHIIILFIYSSSPLNVSRNNLSYNLEILEVIKSKDLNKGGIWMSNISKSESEIASNKYIS